jgi:hypothetical protein
MQPYLIEWTWLVLIVSLLILAWWLFQIEISSENILKENMKNHKLFVKFVSLKLSKIFNWLPLPKIISKICIIRNNWNFNFKRKTNWKSTWWIYIRKGGLYVKIIVAKSSKIKNYLMLIWSELINKFKNIMIKYLISNNLKVPWKLI